MKSIAPLSCQSGKATDTMNAVEIRNLSKGFYCLRAAGQLNVTVPVGAISSLILRKTGLA